MHALLSMAKEYKGLSTYGILDSNRLVSAEDTVDSMQLQALTQARLKLYDALFCNCIMHLKSASCGEKLTFIRRSRHM